ncbi:MAG: hypothetical protein ABFR75_09725 [Acidobacteriota bacterium]
MKNKKYDSRGFSLIEALTTSVILMFVVMTIYTLILQTQSTHVTEGNKLDMNQAARAIDLILCENIRNSGSVLGLLHTPPFLKAPAPFTGIYPLNNKTYPDGIILTSGDMNAVTKVASGSFTPGDSLINVGTVNNQDNSATAWAQNDLGIVVRADGYYVFKVTAPVGLGDTTLTVRATPVYYSGLLNVPGKYVDFSASHLGTLGNSGTYATDSPVFRLNYFNIFLTKTETDGSKTLTLTTDTEGVANVLAPGMMTTARAVPIVPNLEDIQIEYITKDNPPELWASISTTNTNYDDPCQSSGTSSCTNFIQNFVNKNFASVRIFVLFKTEDKHKKEGVGQSYSKPMMGDAIAKVLPAGRFHYTYFTYEVFIRNYNIVY